MIEDFAIFGGSCTTNSCAPESAPLTAQLLIDMMETIKRARPKTPQLTDIKVTRNAVRMQQNKVYPKRRSKSESHHRRMNNKWRRRYGVSYLPAAYTMPRVRMLCFGGGEELIAFVHPDLMKTIPTLPFADGADLSAVKVTYHD